MSVLKLYFMLFGCVYAMWTRKYIFNQLLKSSQIFKQFMELNDEMPIKMFFIRWESAKIILWKLFTKIIIWYEDFLNL